MAKAATTHPPGRGGPGRAGVPLRRGDKYDLVKAVLGVEPITWIEQRRRRTFQRPDGTKGPMSFRAMAEEITGLMHAAGMRGSYVTLESVRRWYRDLYPEG